MVVLIFYGVKCFENIMNLVSNVQHDDRNVVDDDVLKFVKLICRLRSEEETQHVHACILSMKTESLFFLPDDQITDLK